LWTHVNNYKNYTLLEKEKKEKDDMLKFCTKFMKKYKSKNN